MTDKKIIIISDIHGNSCWLDIYTNEMELNNNKIDDLLFIFQGDYFDSFTYTALECLENFRSILKFKKKHPENVILLYGNHDHHYNIDIVSQRYSGFQPLFCDVVKNELRAAINNREIVLAHRESNFLFTHAGVSKTWLYNAFNTMYLSPSDLVERLNEYLIYQPFIYNFQNDPSDVKNTGNSIISSPIWIRPEALQKDCYMPYVQIVGHTRDNEIRINNHLIVCDTHYPQQGETKYLTIKKYKDKIYYTTNII